MSDQQAVEPTPIPPRFELRHRLDLALEHAGVRVSEMGELLGVSGGTMSNYLSGRTSPKDGMMRQWALRCGVPYEWLRTGEEPSSDTGGPNTPGGQGITGTGCDAESAGQVVRLDDWRFADLTELEAVA